MDLGQAWASFGQNIGEGISTAGQDYHKRHVAYDQQMQIAEALSRIGINEKGQITPAVTTDEKGKEQKVQGVQPVLDAKAFERFKTNKQSEWDKNTGALQAINRIGMNAINQTAGQLGQEHLKAAQMANERYPVKVGDTTYSLSAAGAATAGMQQQRYKDADAAAAEKAKLAQNRDVRAQQGLDIRKQQLDVSQQGLGIRKQGVEQKFIQSAPETAFFNKTGLTPQVLLSPDSLEKGYTAFNKGKPLGDIEPLQPGVSLKQFKQPPTGWETFWQTVVKNKPSTEMELKNMPVNFVPKPGSAYRESEYKFPSAQKDPNDPTKPRPAVSVFAPHPEGEFLRIGDNRIPYQDAAQMRATAVRRKTEALDALKTLPLPMIKKRLGDLGYDPNDRFFGLPQ